MSSDAVGFVTADTYHVTMWRRWILQYMCGELTSTCASWDVVLISELKMEEISRKEIQMNGSVMWPGSGTAVLLIHVWKEYFYKSLVVFSFLCVTSLSWMFYGTSSSSSPQRSGVLPPFTPSVNSCSNFRWLTPTLSKYLPFPHYVSRWNQSCRCGTD